MDVSCVIQTNLRPFTPKLEKPSGHPNCFTNRLKNLRNKRNRAHRRWKANPLNLDLLTRLRLLRSRLEAQIKVCKKEYFFQKTRELYWRFKADVKVTK